MPSSFSHREKMRDARRMRASLSSRSSRIILMILSVPGEGEGEAEGEGEGEGPGEGPGERDEERPSSEQCSERSECSDRAST